jgi:hypothetical protein
LLSTAATSTGSVAPSSTLRVTEPSSAPFSPRRPCEAMKTRSQPLLRAASRMASCGRSLVTSIDAATTPPARAAASARASSARALPAAASANTSGDIACSSAPSPRAAMSARTCRKVNRAPPARA